MKRLLFGLLLATACSDLLGGATDDVRVTPSAGTVPILQPRSTVRFTVTNTASQPIALTPCGSATGAYLQHVAGGAWEHYGGGACTAEVKTPVVLDPGASLADSLTMEMESGTYRIVVPYAQPAGEARNAVSTTFEARILPDRAPSTLAMFSLRRFVALALLAACSNPLGGETSDVRVAVTAIESTPWTIGMTTVRFTVTNTTPRPVTLHGCGGGTGAYLQTFENGHWSGEVEAECVAPGGVVARELAPGATVADSLTVVLDTQRYRVTVPYTLPGESRRARSAAFKGLVRPA